MSKSLTGVRREIRVILSVEKSSQKWNCKRGLISTVDPVAY